MLDFETFQEQFPKDDASMRLSHPRRVKALLHEQFSQFKLILGKEWPVIEAAFKQPDFSLAQSTKLAQDKGLYMFLDLIGASTQSPGSTEFGGSIAFLVGLRQHVSPAPHFLIDDKLLELLVHTDLADDIPVSMLRLPYPRMYLELGQQRVISEVVPNLVTQDHLLEGAYFEAGDHVVLGKGVYVVLTGSPLGKANAMDDATQAIFLPTENANKSISDVLHDSLVTARLYSEQAGLTPPMKGIHSPVMGCLRLLTKALLYLTLPEARRSSRLEYSDAVRDVQRMKNPAKRAKALRRVARLHDHILIEAAQAHSIPVSRTEATAADRRAHWRRGHYRMQVHGLGRAERKLIFIQPTLVGAEASAMEQREYLAR